MGEAQPQRSALLLKCVQAFRTPEYTAIPATASTPIASSASISACSRIPPATISCRWVLCRKPLRHLDRKALHGPFPIDVGIKKGPAVRLQLGQGVVRSKLHLVLPALNRHSAVLRIHAEDQLLHAHRAGECARKPGIHQAGSAEERRAHDHSPGSRRQHSGSFFDRADAAPYLARQTPGNPG